MKQYFLLDLDGTIADNGEGILKSAQYALDAFGIHNQPEAKLRQFVGPPLDESFRELYGFSQEQALEAVKKYRERYRVKGVYENKLYPGVARLVKTLSHTNKAEVIQAVLEQLGAPPKSQAVMIGDRKHDILGAKAVGLESIGVEYGFAPEGELQAAGADWIVPTVEALEKLCLSLC